VRYDAAIIGAGADGLAAAATLAKSGMKVVVLERAEQPGGRLLTREFHPGFRASPFCDELPAIPADIFWSLDLGRRGAVFVPSTISRAVWPDRENVLRLGDQPLLRSQGTLAAAALRRAQTEECPPPKRSPFFGAKPAPDPWPGEEWATLSLHEICASGGQDDDIAAHLAARALTGRAAHPDHVGSALHMLAPGEARSGIVMGGLHKLAEALATAAADAGAEISCGLEVAEIQRTGSRASGIALAGGTQIFARAVISTLDLKRTFLSLFPWSALPAETSRRVANFRMGGGTARILLALAKTPAAENLLGAVYAAPDIAMFGASYAAWRSGVMPDNPPATLRVVSATDPSLAPIGSASMTITLGYIPARLFDGAWTHQKREFLLEKALSAAESVFPGLRADVLGAEIITPTDIEEALGLTDGDLGGGENAADQMFRFRPWLDIASPRTPFTGVYLAGPSSAAAPFGTCAPGVIAARALIADLRAGRL